MSLEYIDGFDPYSIANMSQKGWIAPGGSMVAGRFGGQAWTTFNNGLGARALPLGSLATRFIGFAFNPAGSVNAIANLGEMIRFTDGGQTTATTQLQFKVINGFISVARGVITGGGTLLATASTGPVMRSGNWYYVEIGVTIGGAGSVQVKISDGLSSTSIINISGNTQNTVNATFDGIWLTGDASPQCAYDDIYSCTPAGSVNNTFLGEVRVQTIYPVSDGHSVQWSPNTGSGNFSKVNETLVDDDTTYVTSSTPGQLDAYNHAALVTPGSIFGVQTNLTARKDDAGARSVAVDFYDGLTDFINGNAHGLLSNYLDYLDIYETDPGTGAAWTVASFNAKQIGVSMVS